MEMKKRIIVFAPHPDDETLGCGGTIAKKTSEGHEVVIVVMTDGRHAFQKVLGINLDPTPWELKGIRKEEVKRATSVLGVSMKDIIFLDFEDGTLEKNERIAEEKVAEILNRNYPVEVYFPCEKDINPDHRATCRVVRNMMTKLNIVPLTYRYSIAQKYSRIGPMIDALTDLWRHSRIQVDISRFLPLKEAAIKQFKSEISIISSKQQRPIINKIENFLCNKETFYIDNKRTQSNKNRSLAN